jgi:hypothetical protein
MKRSLARWLLLSVVALTLTSASFGQVAVGISVRFGPPALPVYAQPICPGPGYIWTPGYWAWGDDDGYYWVPGTWVVAPVGMLWTPGYWGWGGGVYLWHPGYWGPHVGFYGGINYGYGYGGVGFVGGEWRRGGFYYNRSVTNVSVTNVTNVYNKTVIVNNTTTTSYNGGNGGIPARPSPREEAYARESHTAPLTSQMQHERAASQNRQNFAAENHGRPAIAATARPADFSSRSVVSARAAGGDYRPPAMSPREARVASGRDNRPASNNENRPMPNNGSRPNNANRPNSNEGFRPFTPPNRNNSAAGNERNSRPNENYNRGNQGRNESRPQENRPQENRPRNESVPQNQSRPQEQYHAAPQPRENPRQSAPHSSPPPAPHRQAPPPKEDHRGKGR